MPNSLDYKNESTCKKASPENQPEILLGNPGIGRSWTKGNFVKVQYFPKSEKESFEALLRFWGIVIPSTMETSECQKIFRGFHKIAGKGSRKPETSWYLCTYLFIYLFTGKTCFKIKVITLPASCNTTCSTSKSPFGERYKTGIKTEDSLQCYVGV